MIIKMVQQIGQEILNQMIEKGRGAKGKVRGFAPYPTDLKRVRSGGFLASLEMTGE